MDGSRFGKSRRSAATAKSGQLLMDANSRGVRRLLLLQIVCSSRRCCCCSQTAVDAFRDVEFVQQFFLDCFAGHLQLMQPAAVRRVVEIIRERRKNSRAPTRAQSVYSMRLRRGILRTASPEMRTDRRGGPRRL